jgi:serine protease
MSSGDLVGPLDGGLDYIAGHGTFIAGLIRQTCPDAQILAIRVIRADGVILESELNLALAQLLTLAADHADGMPTGRPIDVINLSLGYYHEDPADLAYDAPLRELTDGFGRLGIPVVVAAGNESTARPSFPAAFAGPDAPMDPQVLPVVSVGALNPDGTIAVFSNSGGWVTHWAPGTAVVSTLPVTFSGGLSPVVGVADPQRDASGTPFARADLDPDGYGGGFGLWSGTSFSAPIVAGMIATTLLKASEDGSYPLRDVDPQVSLARGRNAVEVVTRQCPQPATQRV